MTLLNEIAQDNYICGIIRKQRADEEKNRDNEFRGRMHITDFEKIECCPKAIVEKKLAGKRRPAPVRMLYMMDLGKEIHKSYQTALLKSNKLWAKPALEGALQEKLDKKWPEIPVYIQEYGTSGYLDGIIDYYGRPMVFDLKTVNCDEDTFKFNFLSKFPDPKHRFQVKSYIHFIKRHNYSGLESLWDKGHLVYINTRIQSGNEDAEREVSVDYSAQDEIEHSALWKEVGIQVKAVVDNTISVDCSYCFCPKHASRNKILKEEDSST